LRVGFDASARNAKCGQRAPRELALLMPAQRSSDEFARVIGRVCQVRGREPAARAAGFLLLNYAGTTALDGLRRAIIGQFLMAVS